jgi:hypothetical protein
VRDDKALAQADCAGYVALEGPAYAHARPPGGDAWCGMSAEIIELDVITKLDLTQAKYLAR